MKEKSWITAVLIIAMSLLLFSPLLGTRTKAAEKKVAAGKPFEKELVVLVDTFADDASLPNLGNLANMGLWESMYQYLVYRDTKTGRPDQPGVADRWEVSKDMTKYTFYLQKGIQFHGGWGELTAEDVKFTIEMAARKGSVGARAEYWREGIKSIVAENPYKLTFNLKKPDFMFLQTVSNWIPFAGIICKKYIETVGEREANLKPIGSGPYRLIDRKIGDFIKFEAVADHWRDAPQFKWLTLRTVPEVSTRASMFRSGEADIVSLPSDKIADLEKAGFRTLTNPGALQYWLVLGSLPLATRPEFKPNLPWWADPADTKKWERARKVRMALNLAVNREEINKVIFFGKGSLYGTPCFWPGEKGWDPAWKPYPYDPKKAKQLLAEAGYPNGFEITVVPVNLPGKLVGKDLAEAIAIYWEAIGLKVKRDVMDWVTLKPTMFARTTKGCWPYAANYYDEPVLAFNAVFLSSSNFFTGAEVPYLDELGKRAFNEMDADKRAKLSREFGQFVYDNYLTVPLCGEGINFAVSNKVGDWPLIFGSNNACQLYRITLKR